MKNRVSALTLLALLAAGGCDTLPTASGERAVGARSENVGMFGSGNYADQGDNIGTFGSGTNADEDDNAGAFGSGN